MDAAVTTSTKRQDAEDMATRTFDSGRVFCIGFQKTGTCSMMAALRTLGYRVAGARHDFIQAVHDRDIRPIDDLVERFAAFQDNPWPVLFRLLDERYPGSRFILTVRDEDGWYRSILNHFGVFGERLMGFTYGRRNPAGNEALYRARFRAHNEEVRAYFADRPADFLVMNIREGDGWPELCAFLGVDVIDGPFPHRNERSYSSLVSWINLICTRIVVGFKAGLVRLGLGPREVRPPSSFTFEVTPRFDLPTLPPYEGEI